MLLLLAHYAISRHALRCLLRFSLLIFAVICHAICLFRYSYITCWRAMIIILRLFDAYAMALLFAVHAAA